MSDLTRGLAVAVYLEALTRESLRRYVRPVLMRSPKRGKVVPLKGVGLDLEGLREGLEAARAWRQDRAKRELRPLLTEAERIAWALL